MTGIKRFASRMLAVMLAGALTIGSVSVSAFGADDIVDFDTTSEIATKEVAEETEAEEGVETDSAEDAYIAENAASTAETSAEISVEDSLSTPADETMVPIASYTVTLDANGGYFENEWDDVLEEYVDKTEILNKVIPVGGTVNVVPVNEREDAVPTFLGWSLIRDGEIVWKNKVAVDQSLEEKAENA